MRVIKTISNIEKIKKGCVLTIGNFDGVHIGHQEILTAAKKTAAQAAAECVAMTFEPHPVTVLHAEKASRVLTPLELKKHLLAEFAIDCLIVLGDSRELFNLSARDFVEQFLVKRIQPAVVVEGEDFHFGAGRSGNIHTLRNLGAEKGFGVSVIEPKVAKLSIGRAVKISSTIIRNLLTSGKVADAAVALGRPYRLIGEIVPGRGKGKQLGFPTANLEPANQIVPSQGVYAGFVETGERQEQVCAANVRIPAAFSIGRSRTYGPDNPLMVEAHLLTENVADLNGKWLAMDFVERIRDQRKFETEKELVDQIAKDCEKAREILASKKVRGSK
jgi:riboflavin kinase/FMN adenylyltransferase